MESSWATICVGAISTAGMRGGSVNFPSRAICLILDENLIQRPRLYQTKSPNLSSQITSHGDGASLTSAGTVLISIHFHIQRRPSSTANDRLSVSFSHETVKRVKSLDIRPELDYVTEATSRLHLGAASGSLLKFNFISTQLHHDLQTEHPLP